MRALFALIALFAVAAGPAVAATTVYAASVFATTGAVTAAPNALGPANGAFAGVQRNATLVLSMTTPTTGANTVIAGQRAALTSNVQVAIGEVIAGVATFSANIALPGGLGALHTLDLSAACASVSASGCSLLRIRVLGPPGSAFSVDGLSGVSIFPEPSVWALMLLGFGAVAWRLKRKGRRDADLRDSPLIVH